MAPDGGAGCQYAMEHVTAANPFLSAYSRVSWRWEITNYLGVKLTLQWPIRDLHDNRPKDKILGGFARRLETRIGIGVYLKGVRG